MYILWGITSEYKMYINNTYYYLHICILQQYCRLLPISSFSTYPIQIILASYCIIIIIIIIIIIYSFLLFFIIHCVLKCY